MAMGGEGGRYVPVKEGSTSSSVSEYCAAEAEGNATGALAASATVAASGCPFLASALAPRALPPLASALAPRAFPAKSTGKKVLKTDGKKAPWQLQSESQGTRGGWWACHLLHSSRCGQAQLHTDPR